MIGENRFMVQVEYDPPEHGPLRAFEPKAKLCVRGFGAVVAADVSCDRSLNGIFSKYSRATCEPFNLA